jgi:hypothetical protein
MGNSIANYTHNEPRTTTKMDEFQGWNLQA